MLMAGTRSKFWIKNCIFAVHIMVSIASQRNGNDDIVTKTGDTQLPGEGSTFVPEGAISAQERPR